MTFGFYFYTYVIWILASQSYSIFLSWNFNICVNYIWSVLATSITLKNVERTTLCVYIAARRAGTILGCFWWFHFIIYVFTSTWKRAAVPSGLFLFLYHTLSFSFMQTQTQIHIYLAICYQFRKHTSSFSALLNCIWRDRYTSTLPLSALSRSNTFQCNLTRLCVCVWMCCSLCLHVLDLFNESTCWVGPLHSPSDQYQAGSVSVVAVMESLITQLSKPCSN